MAELELELELELEQEQDQDQEQEQGQGQGQQLLQQQQQQQQQQEYHRHAVGHQSYSGSSNHLLCKQVQRTCSCSIENISTITKDWDPRGDGQAPLIGYRY